jgi:RNA polymerase sigma-70 factor (ECF subfamily)
MNPNPNQSHFAKATSSNSREQLAAIYDAYAAGMYRYALMLLTDHALAEDAVQQTFVKLASQGQKISDIAAHNGYLRTATRNECYRILRRRKNLESANLDSAVILEPVDKESLDTEQRREIEKALRSLPADQREVIHMKVYEQMTFQDIAHALGISINTAASRYRYAAEKLRRRLGLGDAMEEPS